MMEDNDVLKRAWYYITRKRVKTLILILLLFGMGTSLISALSIQKAAAVSEQKSLEKIGSGFTIENNISTNMGTSRGQGTIPRKAIEEIEDLPGVTGCLKRMAGVATMKNAELVPLASGSTLVGSDAQYRQVLDFTGENDTSLDKSFTGGILKLERGRHLQAGDSKKVLIHEEFAKHNQLDIGDTLKLAPCAYDADNKNQSGSVVEAEIVGIFSGKNPRTPSSEFESCENMVFSDLDTVREIYGYTKNTEIYQDALFFTKNASDTADVMKAAKKLNIDWKYYNLEENGNEYVALGESIQTLNRMIGFMLIGTVVVGVVVLSFFLILWIQGRRKEMGILISIGVSKTKIAGQLLCELLLIGIVSFTLSYFGGQAVAGSVGEHFLEQSSKESVENLNSGLNGMLGADLESSVTAQTLEALDVSISHGEIAMLFCVGTGVIVAATMISTIPILRKKPKEILTQMS